MDYGEKLIYFRLIIIALKTCVTSDTYVYVQRDSLNVEYLSYYQRLLIFIMTRMAHYFVNSLDMAEILSS